MCVKRVNGGYFPAIWRLCLKFRNFVFLRSKRRKCMLERTFKSDSQAALVHININCKCVYSRSPIPPIPPRGSTGKLSSSFHQSSFVAFYCSELRPKSTSSPLTSTSSGSYLLRLVVNSSLLLTPLIKC